MTEEQKQGAMAVLLWLQADNAIYIDALIRDGRPEDSIHTAHVFSKAIGQFIDHPDMLDRWEITP